MLAALIVILFRYSQLEFHHGVTIQFQVMVEFWVIVKVVEVAEPVGGTEPVPVQPVQV
jgi:hypothetical protein